MRKHPRKKVHCEFRVYTSIKSGAYTTKVADISKGGAFIQTPFLPKQGEVISFEIINHYLQTLESGNASVVWTKSTGPIKEHGFGISFHEEIADALLDSLSST
ncbi:MAG: PilZ domain-containing protein [Oligoflexia bacterium]|nr:PilZ domain-containing protein [Oligoflexia bacterium]MBF0366073.1 PilZ domain-containing protein [Oligoflexia bacterium]